MCVRSVVCPVFSMYAELSLNWYRKKQQDRKYRNNDLGSDRIQRAHIYYKCSKGKSTEEHMQTQLFALVDRENTLYVTKNTKLQCGVQVELHFIQR